MLCIIWGQTYYRNFIQHHKINRKMKILCLSLLLTFSHLSAKEKDSFRAINEPFKCLIISGIKSANGYEEAVVKIGDNIVVSAEIVIFDKEKKTMLFKNEVALLHNEIIQMPNHKGAWILFTSAVHYKLSKGKWVAETFKKPW